MEFDGPRTAIVTGGAQRIGAAISRALVADGWHVLIHFNTSAGAAAALAAELGAAAATVHADLGDASAAERVMAALPGLPPPRLLVNNASTYQFDTAEDFDVGGWDLHHAVNLRAPALLSQAFAARAGGGLIVNLLDAKLQHLNADHFTYTLSKIGLAGLTELSARAYAPRGIRVCGIAPAITLPSGPQTQAEFERTHARNMLGRGVEVAEIIAALRFIVATPTLTGQTITIDAGQRFLSLARDVQFEVTA